MSGIDDELRRRAELRERIDEDDARIRRTQAEQQATARAIVADFLARARAEGLPTQLLKEERLIRLPPWRWRTERIGGGVTSRGARIKIKNRIEYRVPGDIRGWLIHRELAVSLDGEPLQPRYLALEDDNRAWAGAMGRSAAVSGYQAGWQPAEFVPLDRTVDSEVTGYTGRTRTLVEDVTNLLQQLRRSPTS